MGRYIYACALCAHVRMSIKNYNFSFYILINFVNMGFGKPNLLKNKYESENVWPDLNCFIF